jgi:hypothetical protein
MSTFPFMYAKVRKLSRTGLFFSLNLAGIAQENHHFFPKCPFFPNKSEKISVIISFLIKNDVSSRPFRANFANMPR